MTNATPTLRTRPCEQCGAAMSRYRGRCPDCGYETTWFRLRIWVGAAGVLLGALLILSLLLSLFLA